LDLKKEQQNNKKKGQDRSKITPTRVLYQRKGNENNEIKLKSLKF
jgi:hypothetical protein